MKQLHRTDLYCWSSFDADRNVDFHGLAWARPDGAVLVDPMPLSAHDRAHLEQLGGVAQVLITNSDHVRASEEIAAHFGASIVGPAAEQDGFPLPCDRWLGEGDSPVPRLRCLALEGSKTPGELALLLDDDTLITGDLVRAHRAGELMLLPDAKLSDRQAAVASVRRLAALDGVEAVLVGDGWQVFHDGQARLQELLRRLEA